MKILELNKLNNQQITDIEELAQLCGNYDPYYEELSPNGETCFFLYYEETNLISFLSYLAVASANLLHDTNITAMEAEITAMTLPSKRRQGLFTDLFNCALTQLNNFGVTNVYCVATSAFQNSSLCKGLSHSEYLQKLDIETSRKLTNTFQFTNQRSTKLPTRFHIQLFTRFLNQFTGQSEHLRLAYTFSEDSEIPTTYHLIQRKFFTRSKVIGVCHISEELEFTNIWGVEIKKPYRNQGYGLKLMYFVINDYFKCSSKPLILNVTSTNTYACKLYKRCGFKLVEQINYYNLI